MRTTRCLPTVYLLALCTCTQAESAEVLTAPYVRTGPNIDAVLDDECWRKAAATDAFRRLGTTAPSSVRTEVRVCFSDEKLYVAFRCEEPGSHVRAENTSHQSPGRDDSVEVFLGGRRGDRDYAHFRLGAGGAYYEQTVSGRHKDPSWRTPWTHAVARSAEGWTAEIGIPLFVLGTGKVGPAPLAFNVTRANATDAGMEYYTWASLEGSFHDPAHFGALNGLAGRDLRAACVPMISRTTALSYEVRVDELAYTVQVELVNSGGKSGEATLCLEDRPAAGLPRTVTRTVPVPPVGPQTVLWAVPVMTLGARTARVQVQTAGPVEWHDVQGTAGLCPIKVLPNRSFYTNEREARLICLGVFTDEQAAAAGFQLSAEIRAPDQRTVYRQTLPKPGRRSLFSVPVATLPPASCEALVSLRDRAGAEIARVATKLVKRPPGPAVETKFDFEREVLLVDDEPFFPIGYMALGSSFSEEQFKMFSEGGVNCLVRWTGVVGMGWDAETMEAVRRELVVADRVGIRMFLPLLAFGPRAHYGMENLDRVFAQSIEKMAPGLRFFRDAPALIGYYGMDEPPAQYYKFAQGMYRVLQTEDPYRILYSSSWRDWEPEAYEIFDLLGRHGYWMPYLRFSPNKLARRAAAMRELAQRFHRPFIATPQGCWREESRQITPHEMRISYYLPLTQGAKGLIVFNYRPPIHPAEWKAASGIFQEVRQLAPLLLQEGPPQNIVCDLAAQAEGAALPPGPAAMFTDFKPILQDSSTMELPAVQVLVKNHPDGGEVILAANSADRPREVVYTLNSLTRDTKVVDFFAPQTVYARAGEQSFRDRLGGWDVRVYRTAGPTRRVPHEPVRMSVSVAEEIEPEPPRANLLAGQTPGFEADKLGENWELRDANAVLSTEGPAEGGRCLSIGSNPDGWAVATLKDVRLEAKTEYRICFQYRSAITTGKEQPEALVLVPYQHKTPPRFTIGLPLVQKDWQTFERVFKTDQAVAVHIMLRRRGGRGRFLFDDLRLEALSSLAERPRNLLSNASFEECTYFGKPDWWLTREATSDRERNLTPWERVIETDAVHGRYAARLGFWRVSPPPRGAFRNLIQRGKLDFGENYVFSIYLKADRDHVPATLFLTDISHYARTHPTSFSVQVSVSTDWARYVLSAPCKDAGHRGTREYQVAVRVDSRGDLFADAAQLEIGTAPTPFHPDTYHSPDTGSEYTREAVLGGE